MDTRPIQPGIRGQKSPFKINSGMSFLKQADQKRDLTFLGMESHYKALSNYAKAGLAFKGDHRRLEISQCPVSYEHAVWLDEKYRINLARGSGCNSESIKNIAGLNELHYVLKNARPEQFDPASSEFSINLHCHTTDSDGKLTVQELLDKMADYADNKAKNKPVYLAITNHNAFNDIKAAINIISGNPEKYKNVRLITGIELNVSYDNPEMFSNPFKLDILTYCIDPYNEKFAKIVNDIHKKHFEYAGNILADMGKQGMQFTETEKKEISKQALKDGFSSFATELTKKMAEKPGGAEIEQTLKKHKSARPVIALQDMMKVIIDSQTGEVGLAHPGKIKVRENLNTGISPEEAISRFIKEFKALGGRLAESHYVYTKPYHNKEIEKYGYDTYAWLSHISKCIDAEGLYRSGGVDNHDTSIFSRWNNPDQKD